MARIPRVYRALLRTIDRRITAVSGNTLWRDFVAKEFRRHSKETDPEVVQALLQEAEDYAALVESIHRHKVGPNPRCFLPSRMHGNGAWG